MIPLKEKKNKVKLMFFIYLLTEKLIVLNILNNKYSSFMKYNFCKDQ